MRKRGTSTLAGRPSGCKIGERDNAENEEFPNDIDKERDQTPDEKSEAEFFDIVMEIGG